MMDVPYIIMCKNEEILPSEHIILTFNASILSEKIKKAYLSSPVHSYIPNHLRCFNCQHYDHAKISCCGSLACACCAKVCHDSQNCQKPEHYINCKGDCPAYFCCYSKWIQEKEILTVKTNQNLSALLWSSQNHQISNAFNRNIILWYSWNFAKNLFVMQTFKPCLLSYCSEKCLFYKLYPWNTGHASFETFTISLKPITIEYVKHPIKKFSDSRSSCKKNSLTSITSLTNKNSQSLTDTCLFKK